MKCPVTDRTDVIDDCYITIEFGYGSDKDLMTYSFHTIHDSVGKKVLEAIQSLMPEGRSVEDFGKDEMDDYFGGNAMTWDDWELLSDEEKSNKKKDWGLN